VRLDQLLVELGSPASPAKSARYHAVRRIDVTNLKCLSRKHQLPETFWTGTEGWADQQMPDGTVIWASPSGQTYVTTPGSTLLFPSLCVPSGEPPVADVPLDHCATVVR
jgi:hypothetical protein